MVQRNTRMGLIVVRGIFGMGLLVVAVSIAQVATGQGWAAVIGVLLLVLVLGAVGSLALWLFEAVTQRVR